MLFTNQITILFQIKPHGPHKKNNKIALVKRMIVFLFGTVQVVHCPLRTSTQDENYNQ